MWLENEIFTQDLREFVDIDYIPWDKLRKKTILVTGATGLIGYNLVSALIYADMAKKLDIKIIAPVRDINKAEEKYKAQLADGASLEFIVSEIEKLTALKEKANYIIHSASPTASSYFVEHPVETINTAVVGTMNMLEIARQNKAEGFVYLSSMEIYGTPKSEDVLSEENLGYINPLMVRSSYPESKRICEALCAAYASEYEVPAMSVRLAQTFGPGVKKDDKRVFAEFARCAINGKDITLLTDGSTKQCYIYTMDAVSAILTVLLKGNKGESYNAANTATYCSIKEMAQMVMKEFAGNKNSVIIAENEDGSKKFPPHHFYNLGIERISNLGWKVTKNLHEIYRRLILCM